jgi:hypothetical protein
VSCGAVPDAFLDARLAGAIDLKLHWRAADMQCDGMRRPDGQGLRVTFSGVQDGKRLTLVFGVAHLAEGAAGRAVPVNVTLIREGGAVYGTRGDGKCILDEVHQTPLAPDVPAPAASAAAPAAPKTPPGRRWRIEARGFCLEPARSVGDGRDAILLSTFDFRGALTWEPDPQPTSPAG